MYNRGCTIFWTGTWYNIDVIKGTYQGGYTILLCALIGYWFDDTTNQKTVQNKDDQIPYSDWFKEIRTIECLITK